MPASSASSSADNSRCGRLRSVLGAGLRSVLGSVLRSRARAVLSSTGGRVRRGSLRIRFRAKILQAKKDTDQDKHHHEQRTVVAAALLIGVLKLCQKGLPILYY